MASPGYNPAPQVAPAATPMPVFKPDVSANTFGGATGAALQSAGRSIAGAGDDLAQQAMREKAVFNEARVNEAQAAYLTRISDLLYKPASAEGADDGGFYTKRGENALKAYGDPNKPDDPGGALGAMRKLGVEIESGLASEKQKTMFRDLIRRTEQMHLADMGRYVDRETNQAADKKTEALLAALGNTAAMAINAGNQELFKESLDQGIAAAKSWGSLRGYGEDGGNKYAQEFAGKTVLNAVQLRMQNNDLKGASELLATYRPQMDRASVLAAQTKLKGALEDQAANDYARNAVWRTMEGAPDISSVTGKIIEIEGQGKNPKSSAEGTGQFINSTWLEQVRASRPDLAEVPDNEILAMRNDPEMASAMVQNYAASNAQQLQSANLPVTPGNIYLSHFLGPSGAIKVLSAEPSTPVSDLISPAAIKANPMLQGKTAGDVASWGNMQMAGIQPGTAVKVQKADVLAQADKAFGNDPAMHRKVVAAINRTYTAVQTAAAAEQEMARARNEQAGDTYLRRMIEMQSKGQFDAKIIDEINKDPNLTMTTRDKLWDIYRRETQATAAGDIKTYGKDFYKYFQRVHLPQGDPERITDPTALYGEVRDGGGLTMAGVEKLTGEIRGKRTPQGEAERTMLAQFLKNARGQISGADEGLGLRDPKGEELYLKFLAQALPSFDAGRAAGKSAADLLNPDSKDYIGREISTFKRPLAQWTSDMLTVGADDDVPMEQMTREQLIKAVQGGKIPRADAEAFAIKNGWIRQPAAVQVPLR